MKEARRKMPRAAANARALASTFDHPHFSWLPPLSFQSFSLKVSLTVHTGPLFCASKPFVTPGRTSITVVDPCLDPTRGPGLGSPLCPRRRADLR